MADYLISKVSLKTIMNLIAPEHSCVTFHLRSKQATLAIGFAYSDQEFENLPLEPTDQKLDIIVTERDIIEFT